MKQRNDRNVGNALIDLLGVICYFKVKKVPLYEVLDAVFSNCQSMRLFNCTVLRNTWNLTGNCKLRRQSHCGLSRFIQTKLFH